MTAFVPRTADELALTFPPELQHVSASSLGMLVRCEEQWRQRYMLQKIQPPALAPMLGTADHAAIGHSMTDKIVTGRDLPVGEVREFFVSEIETRVENVGGLSEIEVSGAATLPAKRKVYSDSRKQGEELVGLYHQQISPSVSPVAVEHQFEVQVPEVPVVMMGYIDLIAATPTGATIIDRKRVSQKTQQPKADWSLQAEIYQMAMRMPFEWHLSVTTKQPYIFTADTLMKTAPPEERTVRLVQQLISKLGFLYMRYGPDEPWPTTGKLHPWACNYCGYRPECWGWQE